MIARIYRGVSSWLHAYSLHLLISMHLVGIAGLLSPVQEYFRLLTPFNLMVSAFLLWIHHTDRSRNFILFSVSVFMLGFLVEFIGVNTGMIFGAYRYGASLGPKIFNVPVIIGLNWLLIIYCIASLVDSIRMATWKKILLGSTLAVLMDTLIEPVAMQYDFWSWNSNQIPIQNYIGWFATSLIMFRLYYLFKAKADNRLALGYYFIQLFFFLSLFLFVR
jgi:putative membrane protein